MNVAKYRKKPVVIEAMQFDGHNAFPIRQWGQEGGADIVVRVDDDGNVYLLIRTLEGKMRVDAEDYVIRGVKNEFYPCKPDIFELTYEPVEREPEEICPVCEKPWVTIGHQIFYEYEPVDADGTVRPVMHCSEEQAE